MNFENITEGYRQSFSDEPCASLTVSGARSRTRSFGRSVAPEQVRPNGRTPNINKMTEVEDERFLLQKNGENLNKNSILFIYWRGSSGIGYKFTYNKIVPGISSQHLFRCNGCIRLPKNKKKCSAIVEIHTNGYITVYISKQPKGCFPRPFINVNYQNCGSRIEDINGNVISEASSNDEDNEDDDVDENVEAMHVEMNENNILPQITAENLSVFYNIPSTKKLQEICKIFGIEYQTRFLNSWYSFYQNFTTAPITKSSKILQTYDIVSTMDHFAVLSIFLTSSEDYGNQIKNGIKKYFCEKKITDVEICKEIYATDHLEEAHLNLFAEITDFCIGILFDQNLTVFGNAENALILLTKNEEKFVPILKIQD